MNDRTDDWDVVVVGAGPAGASAALAAQRAQPRTRVLLLDAASFPRDKVCGDGIAPHALDVLAALGLDRSALVDGSAPVERLRLESPGGVVCARPFTRHAYVVPRAVFDARLVAAAVEAGVTLRRHRVRTVRQEAGYAVLDDSIRARTIVAADGAESVLRRAVATPPPTGTVAVAVRGYVQADALPAGEQRLVMSKAGWPAYAWAFPIGDGRANVGYGELLRGDPPSRAHLEQRLADLLPQAVPATLRGHRLPLSTGRPDVGHDHVLLVGDAASLINPLTGEGIYYAVLSGRLAGVAATTTEPAATYRRTLHRALRAHLRQTDLLASASRSTRTLDLGVRLARRSRTAFDALVDFGLAAGTVGPMGLLAAYGSNQHGA